MKISIVTVNRNNKKGLEKTVDSVLNQSARDAVEFIVIDGASTDGSKSILELNASYIDYWVSEPDNGIYHAMNKGVIKSTGDYLLFE